MWPYLWIAAMVGLVSSVVVVAMREKKARAQAIKQLAPQPLDDVPGGSLDGSDGSLNGSLNGGDVSAFADPAADGFGEMDDFAAFEEEK